MQVECPYLFRYDGLNESLYYPLKLRDFSWQFVRQLVAKGETIFSYTLSREYRVVRYRYPRLLFTSEDHLPQFSRARTIDEYDVRMPVPNVRVTSHIKCGDVTTLSQKDRP